MPLKAKRSEFYNAENTKSPIIKFDGVPHQWIISFAFDNSFDSNVLYLRTRVAKLQPKFVERRAYYPIRQLEKLIIRPIREKKTQAPVQVTQPETETQWDAEASWRAAVAA